MQKTNGTKGNYIDLIGQRFGRLVVTRKKENNPNDPIKQRRTGAWWYTDCDCGTKDFIAKGSYLRAGRVKSCGCYNKIASHDKNMIDLTGQKYGMLTVIEEVQRDSFHKSQSLLWRCMCDCGNETIVPSNALRTGKTVSCGCLTSKNEMVIRNYLSSIDINYIKQYHFDDLRSPLTGWLLKFDIAVLDDDENVVFLIEYDGEQHEYGSRFAPTQEENDKKFKRTKLYDHLKNEYCKEHSIDLLRISFRDKDKMIDIINEKLKEKGLI